MASTTLKMNENEILKIWRSVRIKFRLLVQFKKLRASRISQAEQ